MKKRADVEIEYEDFLELREAVEDAAYDIHDEMDRFFRNIDDAMSYLYETAYRCGVSMKDKVTSGTAFIDLGGLQGEVDKFVDAVIAREVELEKQFGTM